MSSSSPLRVLLFTDGAVMVPEAVIKDGALGTLCTSSSSPHPLWLHLDLQGQDGAGIPSCLISQPSVFLLTLGAPVFHSSFMSLTCLLSLGQKLGWIGPTVT